MGKGKGVHMIISNGQTPRTPRVSPSLPESIEVLTTPPTLKKVYAIEILWPDKDSFEVYGRFYESLEDALYAMSSMAKVSEPMKISEIYMKVQRQRV
jgi:hypothetical protein